MLGRQFVDVLVGILAVAAAVAFLLGDTTDGLTILAIVLLNGGLGFVQEWRAGRALAALRAREPDLPMRGVFRTARDWYLWQPGLAEPWQATCWRLDSRLMCALTDAESSTWLDSALEQAILSDRPDER